MKKASLLIVLLIFCSVVFTGCSKTSNLKVSCDGSAVLFNGTPTGLSEWAGTTASHIIDEYFSIKYYICDEGPEDCPHNTAGVLPENMTKKGKAKYYSLYFDTYVYMYYPCGDFWIEGVGGVTQEGRYSLAQIVEYMYADMESMVLVDSIPSVDYMGKLSIATDSWEFKVRPTEVVLPGVLRVKKDDGSKKLNSSAKIGDVTVAALNTAQYDYYKYDDILIQVASGIDINAYIKIEGESK